MLDFAKFEKETKESGRREGEKEGRKKEKMNALKKMAITLRGHGFSDSEILSDLMKNYGQDYSETQLQEYIRQIK